MVTVSDCVGLFDSLLVWDSEVENEFVWDTDCESVGGGVTVSDKL